jgi:hypothetical protein
VRIRDIIQHLFPAEISDRRKELAQGDSVQPAVRDQPPVSRWRFAIDVGSDSDTGTPTSNISTPFSQDSTAELFNSLQEFGNEPANNMLYVDPLSEFITEPASNMPHAEPFAASSLRMSTIPRARSSHGPASHPVPDADFPTSPSTNGAASPVQPLQRQDSEGWWWDPEQDEPLPSAAECPDSARRCRPSSRQQRVTSRLLQTAASNFAAHLDAATALYNLEHPDEFEPLPSGWFPRGYRAAS